MEDDEEALDVYKPSLQVEEPNTDKEEPPSTEQCESVPELDDSQLVGGQSPVTAKDDDLVAENGSESPVTAKDDDLVAEEETPTAETEMEMETETEVAEGGRGGGGKRKRGRNNRVPAKAAPRKRVEEDVCFICFDGGDLVLCDRRGCPKAYHPACVNRDEAFFRAKGRWNCGWHLCSNCEKNAYYMCYTCTYSLCKGCIKDSAILCVRGNKGFCETCMKTVMLIEKNGQGNEEMAQVDFDDKSSWEYLFKDYWIDLKGKLSLTSDEIAQAKNPWKGSDVLAGKQESPDDLYDANNDGGSGSDSSSENLEASNSKKRKTRKRLKSLSKGGDSSSAAVIVGAEVPSMPGSTEWASKELLEFVMHMKNGDKSVLSQFDVQALLLEYIKRNKLRDPRRKSQIICDSRFENLFGKPRVGHFEMLKLLESHFLIKEDSQADDLQGSVVDTEGSQLEADVNTDALMKAGRDRRRKTRRKGDERGPQSNLDDYAAIDIHNINLIFLRRTLMDNLIDDTEKFHEMVVGSFVRIRISGSSQKQDMYRLVQVVGTSKAAEPYKVGKRTTDFMLEIVNLNKSEIISIDIISNQEFTEDECKRLRQSIKCGLINRLTVGDLLEKAMALQAVRVNDWLETEIVRLSHLRDRASEKGRRKELRECVEKLQLLKTAEERQRRLEEIPEIHADPNMDPSYESEEDESETDDKRQENYMKPRDTNFSRRGREPISPRKGGSALNNSWSGTRKNSSKTWELSRNMSSKGFLNKGEDATMAGEIMNENSWNQGRDRDTQQSKTTFNSDPETGGWNSHSVVRSESLSGVASETSVPTPTGVAQSAVKFGETEKMWYYKDPSGTVQGPFSMVQLRKWSNTGYFPADLRIWRSTEKQDDSILLTDVLAGKFQKELPSVDDSFSKEHGPHLSSTYSGKPYETPLQLGRESHSTLASSGQSTGESRKSQPEISSSKGWAAPSFEAPKFATEGWGSDYGSRNDLSNLPSPTPTQSVSGWTRGEASENKWSPASFPVQPAGSVLGSNPSPRGNGALQSPAAVTPESGRLTHSSVPLSSIKPSGGVDGSIVPSASFSQQPSVPGNKEQNALENLGVTAPPSVSNSGGQLTRSSGNDSSSSFTGLSPAPNAEKGIHLSSTNALKVPSQSTVPGESHRVQAGTQPLPAPDLVVASMNPGADTTNAGVSFPNLVQSVTSQNPPVDSHGWGSGSVPRPEMVASCPIPGSESQAWGNAPSQKPEPNTSIPVPAQQPAYGHWGNAPSSVHNSASSFSAGNPAGNLSTPGFSAFPPSDPWRPPIPGNQWESGSNIPPLAPPGLPWGMGVTENPSAAPNLRPENPNTGWAPMPGNTNMGWGGPAPGNTNMQWGTAGQGPASGNANPAGQGLAPGNTNMHWAVVGQGPAPGNANAAGQGPPPGNTNMHWGAAGQGPTPGNANPTGQGPAPGNTNMYWGAVGQGPALGNANPPVQGPAPGNTNMNWGAAVQGPGPVNANPGWVAPSGNPGMWGGDQKHNGDRFSGHRDRGSQGGDSGYGGGRPSWNRQSSFGSGGAGGSSRPLPKGVCVYHENGHCRKGASCNFLHT